MLDYLKKLLTSIKTNKKWILISFISTVVMVVLFFPYDDL
jgi:hypothetical protein